MATDPAIDPSAYASLLVIDVTSGKTLYKSEPTKSWTAASLTKLMTAEAFTATPTKWEASGNILKQDEVGGGRLAVPSGARMTLRDLMYSAIVGSANNAAEALARLDGPGSTAFVKKMNARAQALGLLNTVFHDASGMNPNNKTTAYDMANLFVDAATDPEVKKAMTVPSYQFTVAAKPALAKNVKNTNLLVASDSSIIVTGGKTGYLVESRYNFALSAKPGPGQPPEAGEVLAIVFGAASRDDSQAAAASLAKWSWNSFDWQSTSSTTITFTRSLMLNDKGPDVKRLQQYLNTHGAVIALSGAGSPGHETDLFGPLTRTAFIKFQEARAVDILTPQGITKGTGVLDILTRSYLNEHP